MKSAVSVAHLGGPTIILEIGGLRLKTDPTLDPPCETFSINGKPAYWKIAGPATTDTGKIDAVLLSHDQHGDNLDNAGREFLKSVPKTFTTKIGAERLKGKAVGLLPWETVVLNENVTITSTPARQRVSRITQKTAKCCGNLLARRELPTG